MAYRVPFNRPCVEGNELAYIAQAVNNARLSGDGEFTRRCERILCDAIGAPAALLTPSCTDALELAAMLLNIEPGDEVIVPSFTFVSTANAFVLRGAKIVFADVRRDTLNLDETLLPGLITPRTRAIVPVHYAGVGCEMAAIEDIARANGVAVVEDNAHGLGGAYHKRPLGSFGAFATQSFHETKNVQCGEGGALIINDGQYVERAHIMREKGTDRTKFFLGLVDKYTWVDIGSSYLMSELSAAYLCAQLEACERIQSHRRRVWETYDTALAGWAESNGIRRPSVPEHCDQAYHLYYLILPTAADRDRFIAESAEHGVNCVFHYLPLHESKMGRAVAATEPECPVTSDISARLVRLPFYNDLSEQDQQFAIDVIRRFRCA